MASIIGVETLQHTNGTTAATIDSSGKVSFPNTGEYDIWHQTSNTSTGAGAGDLTTKWARYATNWEKIGTGVSESSGIFTFPSTGKWKVCFAVNFQSTGNASYLGGQIMSSTDSGSTFLSLVDAYGAADHSGAYEFVNMEGYLDVTDASTFRVKFRKDQDIVATLRGSSSSLRTYISFEKLAET